MSIRLHNFLLHQASPGAIGITVKCGKNLHREASLAGRRIVGSRRTLHESSSGPCPVWNPPLPRDAVDPRLHDRAALVKEVVTRVGGDGRRTLDVRQRELREQLVHVVLPRPALEA